MALAVGALAAWPAPVRTEQDFAILGSQRNPAPEAGAYREGEVIVAFREGTGDGEIDRVLRGSGARGARRSRFGPRALVQLEPGESVPSAVARYSTLPGVAWAEPNGLLGVHQATRFTPNDPFFPARQWNMAQLDAERTWGIQKGKVSVAVAVVDTGVAFEDYFDPRTGQSFRKAPDWGETRFLPGYDFANDDAHPNDDHGHGTHVASTIAEGTNNAFWVAGLAFGCAIMPVKALDASGSGTAFAISDAIDYATNYAEGGVRPVKVINLSLGGATSQTIRDAINRAVAAGVLVVASSGNDNSAVGFPASEANVLAVGAVNAAKERARYSSFGPELDVVAPGGDCLRDDDANGVRDCVWQQTLFPDAIDAGRYDTFCLCGIHGTSMAAPHVSATAALLFSQGFTDAAAVRAALEQTAERLGGAPEGGRNDTYGNGLIRPAAALPGLGLNTGPGK